MKMITVFLAVLPFICASWVKEMENPGAGLFEGDIVLTPEQKAKKPGSTFASLKTGLWPKTIAYVVSRELQREPKAMAGIRAAIADYHKYTCIRFVPKSNQRHYFEFYNSGGGCFSTVGYHKRVNRISLSDGCWGKDTVLHEMGHSLGMYHEQSRPDRDRYVKLVLSNVPSGQRHNFDKEPASKIDSRGTPYDYRSMMHYDENAFGGGKRTIITIDPYYQHLIGKGSGFSTLDVVQLNKMYGCPVNHHTFGPTQTPDCHDKSPACANGAAQGHCSMSSWRRWMTGNCKFSCGLCKGGVKPGTPIPPEPVTQGPDGGGNCRDLHTNCAKFKKHCRQRDWVKYMRRNCARTCGYGC